MFALCPPNRNLRCFLSLIVLIANVAAPFRTPNGRALLRCPRQSDTTRSVARVRVMSPSGSFHGFRAITGFAKGNDGKSPAAENAGSFARFSAAVLDARVELPAIPVVQPSHPPLRC
jgi:hypothetical protein